MEFPRLDELLSALAIDTLNIQLLLDRQFEAGLQQTGVTPPRLRLDEFQLDLRVAVAVTPEQGFTLRAVPLNAGFFTRTSARLERQSRVTLAVQQVPLAKEQT